MMSHGGALAATAKEVIKKALDLAAKEPRSGSGRSGVRPGQVPREGHRRVDAVARGRAPLRAGAGHQGLDPDADRFSRRAHIAEVEIDRETGQIDLLRYVAVDDCGRILNHVLLDGQLHGGIVQGLGQAARRARAVRPRRTASSLPARSWTTPCRDPRS
jgi:carbon-monoxide dehydrogenase large subunit